MSNSTETRVLVLQSQSVELLRRELVIITEQKRLVEEELRLVRAEKKRVAGQAGCGVGGGAGEGERNKRQKRTVGRGREGGWEEVGGGLLRALSSNPDAEPFLAPVDLQLYPSYAAIVPHPMDLGTVQGTLSARQYSTPAEFVRDLRLVFSNALLFNPVGNWVRIAAEALSVAFESELTASGLEELARPTQQEAQTLHGAGAMSAAELERLGQWLSSTPEDKLGPVLAVLQAHQQVDDGEEELEVDLGALPVSVLRNLEAYLSSLQSAPVGEEADGKKGEDKPSFVEAPDASSSDSESSDDSDSDSEQDPDKDQLVKLASTGVKGEEKKEVVVELPPPLAVLSSGVSTYLQGPHFFRDTRKAEVMEPVLKNMDAWAALAEPDKKAALEEVEAAGASGEEDLWATFQTREQRQAAAKGGNKFNVEFSSMRSQEEGSTALRDETKRASLLQDTIAPNT